MNIQSRKVVVVVLAVLIVMLALAGSAAARPSVRRSVNNVFWSWDSSTATGRSVLVRTHSGVIARFRPIGLTPGNAVTGWAIIFNQPQNCLPEPYDCGPDDMFHPDGLAEGDFLLTRGHVIGRNGKGNLGAFIKVGDISGSGLAEVICPDDPDGCTSGLTNPDGALIILASHDHGPAQTGQTLEDQVSSFLGGCVGAFNGDAFGFATGPQDVPDGVGECSTIQVSPHMPYAQHHGKH